jgi:GMP synthase-like glutamine amidotransferase
MRVQVFQHAPFEDIGSIRGWLNSRGAEVRYTRWFADERAPEPAEIDMLIAMGGPMSVNDEAALPWLKAEKQAIRDVMARDVPVLGVCLGAQLVASALGARIYRNAVKEIGWFPIQGVAGTTAAFRFPDECLAFHWHGETFDLPSGAVHLARSAACEHQAFQVGHNVLGLQFHLEITGEALRGMVENCRDELTGGPFVQSEAELLAAPAPQVAATNALMNDLLTYLADGRADKALRQRTADAPASVRR